MKLPNTKSKPSAKIALSPLMETLRNAHREKRKFEAEHEPIFTRYHHLKEAVEVAENELRTEAKRIACGYENEYVACEYVMPKHRQLDPAILRKNVSEKILSALGVIETKEFVNEKILKMLVRAKKIKKSVMEAATVESSTGSPRVTITIKDES